MYGHIKLRRIYSMHSIHTSLAWLCLVLLQPQICLALCRDRVLAMDTGLRKVAQSLLRIRCV